VPNLNELRVLDECADEDAVLLMDNCTGHVTDEDLGRLRNAPVRVTTCTCHKSQVFQQLKTSLLGILKRGRQYKLLFDEKEGPPFSY
jgi:hypothetical protein